MKSRQFVICKHCGNTAGMIHDSGVAMICCGEEMERLEANTVDASFEKHVPTLLINGDEIIVDVGSVEHPMQEEHYIQWVYLQTENGGQRKSLKPGQKPKVRFTLADDKPVAVFAFCNLHSLWMKDV